MEILEVTGELLVGERPLPRAPQSLFRDRSRDRIPDPSMRRVNVPDPRLELRPSVRDQDVCVKHQHPVASSNDTETFFQSCELIEDGFLLVEDVSAMHMHVVLLADFDRLQVRLMRDDDAVAEERQVVRKCDPKDVAVFDGDDDCVCHGFIAHQELIASCVKFIASQV